MASRAISGAAFSASMIFRLARHASIRARVIVARHHAVIAPVGVGEKNLSVVLQKIFRSVPAAIECEVEDVVRLGIVAYVNPHPRIGGLADAEHGHDGVVGGHYMRGSHSIPHQLVERLEQMATSPHQTDCVALGELEPLPLKDVLQTVERQIVSELAGHDVSEQPRASHTLVNSRLRPGCYFHPRMVTIALTTHAGILLAHANHALEVAGKVLHLPTLIGPNLMARLTAAGAGPLLAAQLVDARGDGKVFEVGKMAPPSAPLDASLLLLLFRLGWNIARMNRLLLQLLGEVQQQL